MYLLNTKHTCFAEGPNTLLNLNFLEILSYGRS